MGWQIELARAGVDGFQLDEMGFPLHGGGCSHCRSAFEEDTGRQLPADETCNWHQDFSLPVTKAWFNWKVERKRTLALQLKAELAKINPNVIFSSYAVLSTQMTSNGLRAWNSNFLANMDTFDLIGHECQAANTIANSRMFVTGQKLFNAINVLSDASVFTWLYCGDGNSAYFGYAVNNMNAQLPLFFREGEIGKSAVGGDYLAFNANPDNMSRQFARPVRNVAVLVPGQTRDWDSSITMPESPFGIAQTLEELHIPYQLIVEKALAGPSLAQFKVLFVGSASSLSDAQLAAILKFAQNGGTVMFDTTAATRDPLGTRREKWPLADIFGFDQPGRVARATGKAVLLTKKGDIPLSGTSLYYATEFEPEPPRRRTPFAIRFENGAKLPGMITKKYGS
ncbi:MAG: hypothetical protein IJJ33_19095 [Victivallales bacterium]|nr:hypothetical protein [Victivallales bacterium]